MSSRRRAESFVDGLASLRLKDAFNPYTDQCKIWDLPDAVSIRRENLTLMLERALKLGVDAIWVGQEPGWKGARRTGLALTDERALPALSSAWKVKFRRATHGAEMREATAKAVCEALQEVQIRAFLWNAFPLHTHPKDSPLANRAHSSDEGRIGREPLLWLLKELKPSKIIALGIKAETALNRLGVDSVRVRHPGRGGGPTFRADLRRFGF